MLGEAASESATVAVFVVAIGMLMSPNEVGAAPLFSPLVAAASVSPAVEVTFALLAGWLAAMVAALALCFWCRWRASLRSRRKSASTALSSSPASATYSATAENDSAPSHRLVAAFNNFLRSARNSLQLERSSSIEWRGGTVGWVACELQRSSIAPQRSASVAIARDGPFPQEGRFAAGGGAGRRGREMRGVPEVEPEARMEEQMALLADESSLESLFPRFERLVLAFRRSSRLEPLAMQSLPPSNSPSPPALSQPTPLPTPDNWGTPRSEAFFSCVGSDSDLSELSWASVSTGASRTASASTHPTAATRAAKDTS